MFRRLLVAIDSSGGASTTVSFATAIAHQSNASVHVLFVNEFIAASRGVPLHTDDEATELVVGAVEQLRLEGIRASGTVRRAPHRHVARLIASSAVDASADAIVIGSRRPRRFGRSFRNRQHGRIIAFTTLPIITAPAPLAIPAHGRLDADEVREFDASNRQHLTA